jgi:hypothetical protein
MRLKDGQLSVDGMRDVGFISTLGPASDIATSWFGSLNSQQMDNETPVLTLGVTLSVFKDAEVLN